MDANPISFESIEAFSNLIGVELYQWEISALEHLDLAVMNAWHTGRQQHSQSTQPNQTSDLIPADNVAGVKAIFRSLKAKQALKFGE